METAQRRKKQYDWLPGLLVFLCAIQPVMDVVSYWTQEVKYGSVVTMGLRMLLLVGTLAAAIYISNKKRVYWIALGICAVLYGCHLYACVRAGTALNIAVLFEDFTNFIRVAQIPLFTLAFISFLRACETGVEELGKGILLAFFIIAAVELLSLVTGTNPYTYPNKEIGLLGWFYFANSQSAILSMIFPLALCAALRRGKGWLIVLVAVIGFAELYLLATRLAYLAIFVVAAGTVFTWAVCRKLKPAPAAAILICAILCGIGYQISPMNINQNRVDENAVLKQEDITALVEQGKEEFGQDGYEYLTYAYEEYLGGLTDRFGLERVAEIYEKSESASDIANVRLMKLNYCRLILEDYPAVSRVFGLCYSEMTFEDYCYDVENDFHGILYLYGYGGLACFCLFLLYFLAIIIWALVKNPKRYFTVTAGACGVALCMGLAHAYFTAGILRRPNASFYLSLVLAVIWYLIFVKRYDDTKEKKTHVHNK